MPISLLCVCAVNDRDAERRAVESHLADLEGRMGKTAIGLEEEKARKIEVSYR